MLRSCDVFRRWLQSGLASVKKGKSPRLRQRSRETMVVVAAEVERLECRALLTFTYHGGEVIANVQVQNIYLGGDWNGSKILQQIQTRLDSFTSVMVAGTLTDGLTLAEYNVYRGSTVPSVNGNYTLDKSFPDGNNPYTGGLADDPTQAGFAQSIQGLVQDMVTTGQTISPTDNTLFCVYVEPGVTVTMGDGSDSIFYFGGYHGAFAGTNGTGGAQDIRYAVMPFPGFPNNPQNSTTVTANALNSLTVTASHEIAEAMTDPEVTFANNTGDATFVGWYDEDNNGEVSDLSQQYTTITQGYLFQLYEDQNNLLVNPNAVTHTLDKPINLALSNTTATKADLSWSSVALAQGYNIYSVGSDGQQTLLGTVKRGTTTFQLTGLTTGSGGSFMVQVYNGSDFVNSDAVSLPGTASSNSVSNNAVSNSASSGLFVTAYSINGQTAYAIQNGTSTVVFINEHGDVVLGTQSNSSQATVAKWGNDVATFGNGSIHWSDGSVWTQTTTAPPLSVTDYTNAKNGLTAHAIGTGLNTPIFINEHGNIVLGSKTSSTQAVVSAWGNDLATIGGTSISWSDGSVWTQNAAAAAAQSSDVTAFLIGGRSAYMIKTGTNTVVFVNEWGNVVLGTLLSSTQAVVAAWGNDVATIGNGTINWSDGSVWGLATSAPTLSVTSYVNSGNNLGTKVIQTGTNTLVFVNEWGNVVLGSLLSPGQAVVGTWNNDVATIGNNKVTWSDGSIWI